MYKTSFFVVTDQLQEAVARPIDIKQHSSPVLFTTLKFSFATWSYVQKVVRKQEQK
jgi:hypothetical protein